LKNILKLHAFVELRIAYVLLILIAHHRNTRTQGRVI